MEKPKKTKKEVVVINPELPPGSRCSQHCILWDTEDRDCDFYGWQHPPIRMCGLYKLWDLGPSNWEKTGIKIVPQKEK